MKLPVPARFRGDAESADAAPKESSSLTARPPVAATPSASPASPAAPNKPKAPRRPLYVRLLHLRHIAPNAWQRAVLGEGSLGLAIVLVLADLATAWTLLVLPLAVAAVVKAHDLLAWLLGRPAVPPPAPKAAKKQAAPHTVAQALPPADARTAPPPKGWRRQ